MKTTEALWEQIGERLTFLYGAQRAEGIRQDLAAVVSRHDAELRRVERERKAALPSAAWGADTAMLITYGDSLLDGDARPLQALRSFLLEHVGDLLPWVHLLPFYPWSSDDGFAVEDFRAVNPPLGSWREIEELSRNYNLVFDGVINHVSASGTYAKGYLAGEAPYKDYFIALPPDTDTSGVLRTRNLPLLHDYATSEGTKWLWTTFSRDQLDLNFSNPKVLVEIVDVLLFYAERGAGVIRLDAIPYLWKQLGTQCAHLPQTHQIIRLFRDIYDLAAPWMILLTETNNPHQENITYFGNDGDEAQMIYNFTLSPLILFSLVSGDATKLTTWAKQIRTISDRATYLNVTATHDGIGMRPTEGILSEAERKMLVELAEAHQGAMTGKRNSDGSVSPYELNVNYFDAVNDPHSAEPLALQVDRFMVSQAIPLSFIGVPGIYIHSLLGSRNYVEGVQSTGRARTINREQLSLPRLAAELADDASLRHQVFSRYMRLLEIRRRQRAFHPNASQAILDFGPGIFALQRRDERSGQAICALHNMTVAPVTISTGLRGADLLDGGAMLNDLVPLKPYQIRWIETSSS